MPECADHAPVAALRGLTAEVTATRFPSAGWLDSAALPLLLSGDANGELRIWSLHSRRPLAAVKAHGAAVLAVTTLGEQHVLSQGRDGVVRVWAARAGVLSPLVEIPSRCYNFCQCAVHALDWHRPSSAGVVPHAGTNPAMGDARTCTVAPAGEPALLAVPSEDAQELQLWDLRQHKPIHRLRSCRSRSGMCMSVQFAPCGGYVLSGWEDGSLQFHDLRSSCPSAVQPLHAGPLLCIGLHTNDEEHHAITGGADCKLRVAEIRRAGSSLKCGLAGESELCPRDGQHPLVIPASNEASGAGGISSLAMRPDGRHFSRTAPFNTATAAAAGTGLVDGTDRHTQHIPNNALSLPTTRIRCLQVVCVWWLGPTGPAVAVAQQRTTAPADCGAAAPLGDCKCGQLFQ